MEPTDRTKSLAVAITMFCTLHDCLYTHSVVDRQIANALKDPDGAFKAVTEYFLRR